MSQLKGAIIALALCALAALGFGLWRHEDGRRASASTALVEAAPLQPAPTVGGRPQSMSPHLVATWATRVGPYAVCVSSVRSIQEMARRMSGRPSSQSIMASIGKYYLVLQMMRGDDEPAEVELDVDSIQVTDDLGTRVSRDTTAPDPSMPVSFPGGVGYVIPLQPLKSGSNMMRSVEGDLILESGRRKHFRIVDVPLPLQRVRRLFGRMALRKLSAEDEARLPDGLLVLDKQEAESVLARSSPAEGPFSAGPQRLVFTNGVPVSIGIPSPLALDPLRMTAAIGSMGSMEIQVRHGDQIHQSRLWDYDVALIVLPRSGDLPRRAGAIRLSRDGTVAPNNPLIPPTFLPEPGRPGGAIVSKVLVGERPFGRGYVQIELRQFHAGVWSQPRVTNAPIDVEGTISLANLAPGTYSLRRPASRVTPELPFGEPLPPLEAYMSNRFGVSTGQWEGEEIEHIDVRTGQRTEIPPLRYLPSNSPRTFVK